MYVFSLNVSFFVLHLYESIHELKMSDKDITLGIYTMMYVIKLQNCLYNKNLKFKS